MLSRAAPGEDRRGIKAVDVNEVIEKQIVVYVPVTLTRYVKDKDEWGNVVERVLCRQASQSTPLINGFWADLGEIKLTAA